MSATQDLGVLGELGARAAERVARARADMPLPEMAARARAQGPARDALSALREARRPAVIAEFKRRSPSKGAIRADADPAEQARAYTRAGATVLSVLTEPTRFGGSLDDLRTVRRVTDLPILEKDFVVDPYQIYEARACGADLVLLIVKLVGDRLTELLDVVHDLGMTALVEVHDAEDLAKAHASRAALIGVNSRDLRSLTVDLEGALSLLSQVATDRFVLAESGLAGEADVRRAIRAGADGVLVGEYLMRSGDPAQAVEELRQAGKLFVKVCGMQSLSDCETAGQAGADAVSFVFADSPRRVNASLARDAAQGPAQGLERIGVFTTQGVAEILETASKARLTGIQLHGGAESLGTVSEIRAAGFAVLAAVSRSADGIGERLTALSHAGAVPLLDARVGDRPDGQGGSLDLGWARGAAVHARRFVIAGGLTPETVAEAVQATGAYGVDVSSGVEERQADGTRRKNPERTQAFVRRARDAGGAAVRWWPDPRDVDVEVGAAGRD